MQAIRTTVMAAGLTLITSFGQADPGDQLLKLLPADGAAEDGFGAAIDMAGGVIVVGAPGDDDRGVDSGSAYLFDADGVQLAKLTAEDGAAGDQFGWSVAIDGDLVVIGAIGDDDRGAGAGSTYLFSVATGVQLMKLTPNGGAAGDEFGFSVAVEGDLVIVGSKRDDDQGADSGAAYVFDGSTGAQLHKLLPDDGVANDNFGGAVAIDSGVVVIGAHGKWNGPLFLAGAAYLFDAVAGEQLHKLLPDDAAVSDFFGASVDIDDGVVMVGAWAKNIVFDHSGAAYLFDASTGDQFGPRLAPADTADRDNFGYAVAIEDGLAAASAPGDSDGGLSEAGSAYVYSAPDGQEIMEVRADDRAPLDNMGSGIAISDGFLVVGVDRDDDNGANSGSAYVFDLGKNICPADLDDDGVVGGSDLSILLANWGGPGDADLNDDGVTNGADLAMLLAAWGGCSK